MEQIEEISWGWQADYWEKMDKVAEIQKEYWKLRLELLKKTKPKVETIQPSVKDETIPVDEHRICINCEHSLLPESSVPCQTCKDHSNFVPKQR